MVNFKQNEIEYLDSFNSRRTSYIDIVKRNLETEGKNLCQHDTAALLLTPSTRMPFLKRKRDRNLPLQMNGHDCGIFCIYYVVYRVMNIPMDFTQKDTERLREHMLLSLLVEDPTYH